MWRLRSENYVEITQSQSTWMNLKSMEYKQRVSIVEVENKKVRIFISIYYCISLARDPIYTHIYTVQHSYTNIKTRSYLYSIYLSISMLCLFRLLLLLVVQHHLDRCVFAHYEKHRRTWACVWWWRMMMMMVANDDDGDAKQLQNCLDVSFFSQQKHCFHFTYFETSTIHSLCFRFCLCFFFSSFRRIFSVCVCFFFIALQIYA